MAYSTKKSKANITKLRDKYFAYKTEAEKKAFRDGGNFAYESLKMDERKR